MLYCFIASCRAESCTLEASLSPGVVTCEDTVCMLLVAAACFVPGYTFAGSEDEHTIHMGWFIMGVGVLGTIILPPLFCKGASMRSQLEDQELSIAVIRIFKSLPSILPSMVYLASPPWCTLRLRL